ncbi:hypothetical protein ACOJQI_03135 [Bacillus salacetis]|uniref:hypothetical protein n=1 Tax=Bacillus salacetis TaxID=2315464 RepID=UPI003BA25E10
MDVLNAIKNAYNKKNKIKARLYESVLENGMVIHFYQHDDKDTGKVTTAYPKYRH